MGMIINYSAAIGLFDWLTFKYVKLENGKL